MATTNFKLTKDSIIRRASLPYRPSWDVLAGRIQSLFDIPVESIAVSYVDLDGDVVTLSSNEELQEYYVSSLTPNTQLVKFNVIELSSLRDTVSPASTARPIPNAGTHRPASGSEGNYGLGEEFFDIGTEWQHYPDPRTFSAIFNGAVPIHNNERTPSELSHGFIETVHSDTSSISKAFDSEAESDNDSDIVDLSEVQVDKGKGRANIPTRPTMEEVPDEEASSTRSMLCEDAPEKPPVHVYEHEQTESSAPSEKVPSVAATPTPLSPSQPPSSHHSTPRFSSQSVGKAASQVSFNEKSVSEAGAAQDEEPAPDPPLADVPPVEPTSNTTPTFSNDIAAYITNVVNAFSAHPELSEGLRNLLDNARNGTYWAAHREALSRAASVAQGDAYVASADLRRAAEEEASRRVTEALGAVVRSLTNLTGVSSGSGAVAQGNHTSNQGRDADEQSDQLGDDATVRNSLWGDFPRSGRRSSARRTSWGLPHYGPTQSFDWTRPFSYWGAGAETPASFNPFDPVTPVPGRPPARNMSERFSGSSRPHSQHGPPGFPRGPGPHPPWEHYFGWPSSRHPPPPPPVGPHPPHGPPPPRGGAPPPPPPPPHTFPPARGPRGPPPPPPRPFDSSPHRPPLQHLASGHTEGYFMPPLSENPSPQELKERVEIAKQVYQMEKARFRKDREERKRDKRLNEEANDTPKQTKSAPPAAPAAPAAPPAGEAVPAPVVPPRPAAVASTPPNKNSQSTKASTPQIASVARGSFPHLEVVSVSKDSPKLSPHQRTLSQSQRPLVKKAVTPPQPTAGPSGINRDGLNGRQRSLHRITKKLADMGFTPTSYSSLPAKIESQVGPVAPATKDEEDNVVTSVLEELLNMSPQSSATPVPSRAERRQSKIDDSSSIPGSWSH